MKLFFSCALACCTLFLTAQTWTSVQAGDWESASTWDRSDTPPLKLEDGDKVIINHGIPGDPIFIDGNSLDLENGGELEMDGGMLLLTSGNFKTVSKASENQISRVDITNSIIRVAEDGSGSGNFTNSDASVISIDNACIQVYNGTFENIKAIIEGTGSIKVFNGNIVFDNASPGLWSGTVEWCIDNGNDAVDDITNLSVNNVERCDLVDQNCASISMLLPVELISFSAEAESPDVSIQWHTAYEINLEKTVVEYSLDGSTFFKVKELISSGPKPNGDTYTLKHVNALNMPAENAFYRLVHHNLDGSTDVSSVISISLTNSAELPFPNPIQAGENLNYRSTGREMILYDALGRELNVGTVLKGSTYQINTSDLKQGIYYLHLGRLTHRIIIY
ncbi:MAG: T9SS type A sorting domain-containing protein [Saprospiraceae bacterium]|nr:T9SS type A sorting domain-containing protein [Saprospiraceae bacterium]